MTKQDDDYPPCPHGYSTNLSSSRRLHLRSTRRTSARGSTMYRSWSASIARSNPSQTRILTARTQSTVRATVLSTSTDAECTRMADWNRFSAHLAASLLERLIAPRTAQAILKKVGRLAKSKVDSLKNGKLGNTPDTKLETNRSKFEASGCSGKLVNNEIGYCRLTGRPRGVSPASAPPVRKCDLLLELDAS